MKFEFRLNGRDWFWLYAIGLVLYATQITENQMLINLKSMIPGSVDPSSAGQILLIMLFVCIAGFIAWAFLGIAIIRKFLANTKLGEAEFKYTGTTIGFVFRYIWYSALAIMTLGVYSPWAIKNIFKHIAGNIEYRQNKFRFEGDGFSLLLIIIGTLLLPLALVGYGFATTTKGFEFSSISKIPLIISFYLAIIPFTYFALKWMINIHYSSYQIRWDSKAIPSILKILQELILSIVTLGVYAPAAHVRLYTYFADKTNITGDDGTSYRLKTSLNTFEAWKTIWIQCLLTIITVGIYGAWAYCKIIALYANNTSIERA